MSWFAKTDKVIVKISKGISWCSVACIVVMGFLSVIDILSSKIFGRAIPFQGELIQYLMVPVFCCFLANIQLTNGIMAVDILSRRYSKTGTKIVTTVSNILGAAIYGFAAWKSVGLVQNYFAKKTASSMSSSSFVLWPFALILCICLFAFALSFLWSTVRLYMPAETDGLKQEDVAQNNPE